MTEQIDVVIPVHPKDFGSLDLTIRSVNANIREVRRVFVVSAEPYAPVSQNTHFVPEPALPGFPTAEDVRGRWEREYPPFAVRAGWVYQQILKLGAAVYIEDLLPTYLAIDADTIFLRPVQFLFRGAPFVYTNNTDHALPQYMDSHRRLTGEEPVGPSFICHHMLYDQKLLNELFAHVERLHAKAWFDAYLDSIDYREFSPISEYEIYASWVLTHHRDRAVHRQLSWSDISYVPNRVQRWWLRRRFDFVSAHAYMRRPIIRRIRDRLAGMMSRLLHRIPGARRLLPGSLPESSSSRSDS